MLTLAVAILASAGASWKLRSSGKWTRTRSARSIVTFGILLVAVLSCNTRWTAFLETIQYAVLIAPSPHTWRMVADTVPSPAMLFGWLFVLYMGFISYYTLQSIRSIERQ
jgi:hypothetical protein